MRPVTQSRILVRLAALLLIILTTGCYVSPLSRAREQVPIETTRSDAIRILNDQAWYHQECPNRITIDDLFFFGSRSYDDAQVVIVGSEPIDGEYIVYIISSFEANAWHAAYQDCLQRDRFEE